MTHAKAVSPREDKGKAFEWSLRQETEPYEILLEIQDLSNKTSQSFLGSDKLLSLSFVYFGQEGAIAVC